MNEDDFWNSLNENEKDMVVEIWPEGDKEYGYNRKKIIFNLFKNGANDNGYTVEEYINEITPSKYVIRIFESKFEMGNIDIGTYEKLHPNF